MNIALGKKDHPGRLVGVGHQRGIRQYHGKVPRHSRVPDLDALKAELRAEMMPDLLQQLRAEMSQYIPDMTNTNIQQPSHRASTKESFTEVSNYLRLSIQFKYRKLCFLIHFIFVV